MPSCSPFSSMTRISRARIRSLMRIKDFAERLSSAMVLLQRVVRCPPPGCNPESPRAQRTHPEYSIGLAALNKARLRRISAAGSVAARSALASDPLRGQAGDLARRTQPIGGQHGPSSSTGRKFSVSAAVRPAPPISAGVCSVMASSSRPTNRLRWVHTFLGRKRA